MVSNYLYFVRTFHDFVVEAAGELWLLKGLATSLVLAVRLLLHSRGHVPSEVSDLWGPGEVTLLLNLGSRSLGYFLPVGTANDHRKTDVEDDARNGKAKPEASNAHFFLEAKDKGERHAKDVVAEKGEDGAVDLQAEASDDA